MFLKVIGFSGFFFKSVIILFWVCSCFSADEHTVVKYNFNNISPDWKRHVKMVQDVATSQIDTVYGTYATGRAGISGQALLLDGYSAFLKKTAKKMSALGDLFTVEAWIAPGAYPTNWCSLLGQTDGKSRGFSLSIDDRGRFRLTVFTTNGQENISTEKGVSLRKWAHVAGVYDDGLLTLYVNGQKKTEKRVNGHFIQARDVDVIVGRSFDKSKPTGVIRQHGTEKVYHYFDGLLDNITIHNEALASDYFQDVQKKIATLLQDALPERHLPTLKNKESVFGAVYSDLKYYESWDNFWRMSGEPDVVVTFDKMEGQFVFWRGTSYIPHWVTENGIWYDNEFTETWSQHGCHEPMSDKRCHHSQVKIIENTDARVVVHWRYALIDNWYKMARVDSITGWGEWTDEIYTIYPDGTAVRKIILHSTEPDSPHEWHEGIIVLGPGQHPEDVLHKDALVLANMKGEKHIYSWQIVEEQKSEPGKTFVMHKKTKWLEKPGDANIHLVNTKSKLKPFTIVHPDAHAKFDFYDGEFRRDISIFPWWNHWPTATKPSDGRYAMSTDRAAHSSISHIRDWEPFERTEYSQTRLMLVGLTEKKADQLADLASSWAFAPNVKTISGLTGDPEYDRSQKAYILHVQKQANEIKLIVDASRNRPALNPAFILKGLKKGHYTISINGKIKNKDQDFRLGYTRDENGSAMILWFDHAFYRETNVDIMTGSF